MRNARSPLIVAAAQSMFLDAEASGGLFYATGIARLYRKVPGEFLRLPSTIEYIEAIQRVTGETHADCVQTRRGGHCSEAGTWLSRRLRGPFAAWLDVNLSVWVDMRRGAAMEELIRSGQFAVGAEKFAPAQEITHA